MKLFFAVILGFWGTLTILRVLELLLFARQLNESMLLMGILWILLAAVLYNKSKANRKKQQLDSKTNQTTEKN